MLSKTKLGEDIPGGSSSESVPTSDELDHGALIADPTGFDGPVAVTRTPPGRAAIVLLLHRRLPFPDRNRRHPARGCWLHPPPGGDGFTVGFVQSFGGTLSRCAQRKAHCPGRPVAGPGIVVDMRRDASGTCCAGRAILYAAWLSGKTVGATIWFIVSAPMFHRSGDHRSCGEPNAATCRTRSRQRKWRAIPPNGHQARLPSVSPPPKPLWRAVASLLVEDDVFDWAGHRMCSRSRGPATVHRCRLKGFAVIATGWPTTDAADSEVLCASALADRDELSVPGRMVRLAAVATVAAALALEIFRTSR
jgi:hypothetical protein